MRIKIDSVPCTGRDLVINVPVEREVAENEATIPAGVY
jgi:hypothetical protein